MEPFEISWTAPEYEYRPKDVGWYWATMIVAILVLAAAILMQNFLFGAFVILAELLILTWGNRQPVQLPFLLTEKSITIGPKLHMLSKIKAFSADERPWHDWQGIVLHFSERVRPTMKILVPLSRFPEVRQHLAALVPEVEHEDNFIDTLEELFRF